MCENIRVPPLGVELSQEIFINDVALTPVRRQSAASEPILLRLVPRASERTFAPPAFENSRHVIKRRNIDVDATQKRCIGVNIAS